MLGLGSFKENWVYRYRSSKRGVSNYFIQPVPTRWDMVKFRCYKIKMWFMWVFTDKVQRVKWGGIVVYYDGKNYII
jgi:hypothetical protein